MRIAVLVILLAPMAWIGCGNSHDPSRPPRPYPPGSGRAAEQTCPATRPAGQVSAGVEGDCKADADCTTGKNGRCLTGGNRVQINRCTYDACSHDGDCTSGGPCECQTYGNVCLSGNCKVDSDCGAGGSCGRSNSMACRGGEPAYYCRTPADTCMPDSECTDGQCVFSPEVGHWSCQKYPRCPVG